jgi:hypothetical protein
VEDKNKKDGGGAVGKEVREKNAQSRGLSASFSWCAWYLYVNPCPALRSGINLVNIAKAFASSPGNFLF